MGHPPEVGAGTINGNNLDPVAGIISWLLSTCCCPSCPDCVRHGASKLQNPGGASAPSPYFSAFAALGGLLVLVLGGKVGASDALRLPNCQVPVLALIQCPARRYKIATILSGQGKSGARWEISILNLSKADGIGVVGEDEETLEQNKEKPFPGSMGRHCERGRPGKFI